MSRAYLALSSPLRRAKRRSVRGPPERGGGSPRSSSGGVDADAIVGGDRTGSTPAEGRPSAAPLPPRRLSGDGQRLGEAGQRVGVAMGRAVAEDHEPGPQAGQAPDRRP